MKNSSIYETPNLKVLNLEVESAILQASGEDSYVELELW